MLMHPFEQAGLTERSEFVRYFMKYGLERCGTQVRSYRNRFTLYESKRIHLCI